MEPLMPQPGSPVDPRNAVGRRDTTHRARRELLAHNNLCLTDPRRMGKTVWLDLFCSNPGDGLVAIKIDFEGVQNREEFLLRTVAALRLHSGLPRQALTRLKAMFDGVEVTAGPVSVRAGVASRTPTELLTDTIRSVDAHVDDGTLFVIAMDEVPIALSNITANEGPAAANQMLQALRQLRGGKTRLRWIVSGSIGFHHILRRCDATEGAINDLVNLPLGPLPDPDAHELATRLLLGIARQADAQAIEAMIEQTGRIPFLIHGLAHRLHDAGTGPVTADGVHTAFTEYMDDRDDSRAATHLLTRLSPLYGDRAAAAEAILDRLAVNDAADLGDLQATTDVLNDLIDDHYLIEERGAQHWRYEVLRRIWAHRRRLT